MLPVLQSVAVALGLTTIGLLWVIDPVVNPSHHAVYHWSGAPLRLFLPVTIDFLVVWLLVTATLFSARNRASWRIALWLAILLFTPFVALKSWALYEATDPSHVISRSLFIGGLVLYLLSIVFWRSEFNRLFDRILEFASTLLVFMGVAGAALLCQVLWFGYRAGDVAVRQTLHRPKERLVGRDGRSRIIWIIFDELSYRQVFEHRYPGLQLPAFDAFAEQASVFTDVVPAGNLTERVVPALLTGTPVDLIRASPDGKLFVHSHVTNAWGSFDQHNTVFQDALNTGHSTAVVGWYNPYCRVLPAVLDQCFWTNNLPLANGMAPIAGLASNMLAPLEVLTGRGVLQRILHQRFSTPPIQVRYSELHAADYQLIAGAADKVLSDPSADFVLLHYPIPHPPGIYNRATGRIDNKTATYIANLALADRTLAHIRSTLEHDGQWDASTIVIMGDHSWRTPSWRTDFGWSSEEERASDAGKFDSRPAYLVKCPRQQTGEVVTTPFLALQTRKLMDAFLSGDVRSARDLGNWVEDTQVE